MLTAVIIFFGVHSTHKLTSGKSAIVAGIPLVFSILSIWSSGNTAVGTINATTGVFTPVAKGSTTITASSATNLSANGTASVTVTPGNTTVGVFRDGMFYLKNSNEAGAAGDINFGFGLPTDTPLVGDWDGQ